MLPFSDVTALILAGGMGTRLRDVVSDRPKVLAEVNGRPFLSFLLDMLADSGLSRVVLCTGYMASQVKESFGGRYKNMALAYSEEGSPSGTGGALRLALPLADSDPLLVMNGDSYCNADLQQFFQQHVRANSRASLLLTGLEETSRYGTVKTDETGVVTSFIEKGEAAGPGLINAGIYLIAREVIQSIPASVTASLERELFPCLIGNGLHGFFQDSEFIDIGIPSDYIAASAIVGNQRSRGQS